MNRWVAALALLAGCGSAADTSCDEFTAVVSVYDPQNQPLSDATVEMDDVECPSNGDGTYTCTGAMNGELHNIGAVQTMFSAVAKNIETPPDCEAPVEVELILNAMMGA